MFAGLNDIPWHELKQPYGTAEEVPVWLRMLRSPRRIERKRALRGLDRTMTHQGWAETATAPAVPYIIALLQSPEITETDELLQLLTLIAQVQSWVEGREDEVAALTDRDYAKRLLDDSKTSQDARMATRAGMSVYAALLIDPRPSVRRNTAILLTQFRERQTEVRTLLMQALEREADSSIANYFVFLLGSVSADWEEANDFFAAHYHQAMQDLTRLYAGLGWLQSDQTTITSSVIARLNTTLRQLLPQHFEPYHLSQLFNAYFAALRRMPPTRLHALMPLFIETMMQMNTYQGYDFAFLLFIIAFHDPTSPITLPVTTATLTQHQREVLTAIVLTTSLWQTLDIDFINMLTADGLPTARDELAALLDLTAIPPLPLEEKVMRAANAAPVDDAVDAIPQRMLFLRQTEKFRDDEDDLLKRYHQSLSAHYPDLDLRLLKAQGYTRDMRNLPPYHRVEIGRGSEVIIRFPFTEEARQAGIHEVALLQALQGRLPVPIPQPLYSALITPPLHECFWGYPFLPGQPLTWTEVANMEAEAQQVSLAQQVAEFLRTLHSITPDDVPPELPRTWDWDAIMAIEEQCHILPLTSSQRDLIALRFNDFRHMPRATPVVVHGHCYPDYIRYDAQQEKLTGIVHFNDAGWGDPAIDLGALLREYPFEFFQAIATAYGADDDLIARSDFFAGWWCLLHALKLVSAAHLQYEHDSNDALRELDTLWS